MRCASFPVLPLAPATFASVLFMKGFVAITVSSYCLVKLIDYQIVMWQLFCFAHARSPPIL